MHIVSKKSVFMRVKYNIISAIKILSDDSSYLFLNLSIKPLISIEVSTEAWKSRKVKDFPLGSGKVMGDRSFIPASQRKVYEHVSRLFCGTIQSYASSELLKLSNQRSTIRAMVCDSQGDFEFPPLNSLLS